VPNKHVAFISVRKYTPKNKNYVKRKETNEQEKHIKYNRPNYKPIIKCYT